MKTRLFYRILFSFLALSAWSQTASDYTITGDARLGLPGPDIVESSYTRNPASCAMNIHSSLMMGALAYPAHINGASSPVGLFTALSLPNFSLMNTTANFGLWENEVLVAVTKNLLGLQFALSTLDLGIHSPLKVSLGLGAYADGEKRGEQTSASFVADLGCIATIDDLSIEILAQNLYRYSLSGESSFAGPSSEFKARLRSKLILDIFFSLGIATANNIPTADMVMELQMYRHFFSQSLRTGIDLNVQCDFSPTEFLIPGQSYGFTIAYFLPELSKPSGDKKDFLSRISEGMKGFALYGRGAVTIINGDENPSASPVISLGLSRFF